MARSHTDRPAPPYDFKFSCFGRRVRRGTDVYCQHRTSDVLDGTSSGNRGGSKASARGPHELASVAAGGGNDILARLLAQRMGATLGQQFVIENRPGAGGTVGARAVAKARPD